MEAKKPVAIVKQQEKMYAFTDREKQNLLEFLNRVKYEGLKEVTAINEIMNRLSKPVETKKDAK